MCKKLSPTKIGLAAGITAGITSVVCAALILVAPQATMGLFGNLFHGIDLTQITKPAVTLTEMGIGIAVAFVLFFAIGAVFAVVHNFFSRKEECCEGDKKEGCKC